MKKYFFTLWNGLLPKQAFGLLVIAYLLFLTIITFLAGAKYANFGYNALDLAINNQVYFNTLGGSVTTTLQHPPEYFGYHFSPVIFLLIPFYFLLRHPVFLVALQAAVLGASAFPLFFSAKKFFSIRGALGLAGLWLINPFVYNLSLYEFHNLALAALPVTLAIFFYLDKKLPRFVASLILALVIREDVALVVIMFSLLAWLDRRAWSWRLIPLVLGGSYFFVAMRYIKSLSDMGGYKYALYYSYLGATPQAMLKTLFAHPHILIYKFLSLGNIEFLLGLLLPFAFVPVARLRPMLLALPIYAQLFLSETGTSSLILRTQYITLFLPALFLALIESFYALSRSKNKLVIYCRQEKLGWLIFSVATVYGFLTLGPLLGIIAHNIIGSDRALAAQTQQILNQIPKNAAVMAGYNHLSQLSSRREIYAFNNVFIGHGQFGTSEYQLPNQTEYLLLDSRDFVSFETQYRNHALHHDYFSSGDDRLRENIVNNHFGVLDAWDSLVLYKKNTPDTFVPYQPLNDIPKDITSLHNQFGPLSLLGILPAHYDGKRQALDLSLIWRKEDEAEKNIFLHLIMKKNGQAVREILIPINYGLLPFAEWTKGQKMQTNYRLYVPEFVQGGYKIIIEPQYIIHGNLILDSALTAQTFIEQSESLGLATLSF